MKTYIFRIVALLVMISIVVASQFIYTSKDAVLLEEPTQVSKVETTTEPETATEATTIIETTTETTTKKTEPTTITEPTTQGSLFLSEVLASKYGSSEFYVGQVVGRVYSSSLNINCNLIYGTTDACLNLGAGLHQCSSLPGMKTPIDEFATCPIIAGHCQTVFQGLSKVDPNICSNPYDYTITLVMPYGNYVYQITNLYVANASSFSFPAHRAMYGNYEPDIIILYTCYPFGQAGYEKSDRLFITCKLISGNELVDDR